MRTLRVLGSEADLVIYTVPLPLWIRLLLLAAVIGILVFLGLFLLRESRRKGPPQPPRR